MVLAWHVLTLCLMLVIGAIFASSAVCDTADEGSAPRGLPDDRVYLDVRNGSDISEALQEAIDTVSGYRADTDTEERGGTVTIPSGDFHLSKTIHVPGYVTVEGAGGESTYLIRSGDYGDTLVVGDDSGSAAIGVTVRNLTLMHSIGQFNNLKDESTFENSVAPGSAHIRAWSPIRCHFEKLWLLNNDYGLVMYGGSTSSVRHCTFRGLWDEERPRLQHSQSAILVDSNPVSGMHPTDLHIEGCSIIGYLSGPRTKAIHLAGGAVEAPVRIQNIAYRYGIHVRSIEVMHITGGNIGGCYDSAVFLEPAAGKPLLNVMMQSIFFDGQGRRAVRIFGDKHEVAYNTGIVNCVFIGQANSEAAIMTEYSEKSPTCTSLTIANNAFTSYIVTPILIESGAGIVISGNTVRAYNTNNLFPEDPKLGAGIYVGPAARHVSITSNIVGGGNGFEPFDTTLTAAETSLNACAYGIVVDGAQNVRVASNLNAGINPANEFELFRDGDD